MDYMDRLSARDIALAVIVLALDLVGFLVASSMDPTPFNTALSPAQFWLILGAIIAKGFLLLWRRKFPLSVLLGISATELLWSLYCLVTADHSLGYNGIAASVAAFSLALHTKSKTRDSISLIISGLIVGTLRAIAMPPLGGIEPPLFTLLTALGWMLPPHCALCYWTRCPQ